RERGDGAPPRRRAAARRAGRPAAPLGPVVEQHLLEREGRAPHRDHRSLRARHGADADQPDPQTDVRWPSRSRSLRHAKNPRVPARRRLRQERSAVAVARAGRDRQERARRADAASADRRRRRATVAAVHHQQGLREAEAARQSAVARGRRRVDVLRRGGGRRALHRRQLRARTEGSVAGGLRRIRRGDDRGAVARRRRARGGGVRPRLLRDAARARRARPGERAALLDGGAGQESGALGGGRLRRRGLVDRVQMVPRRRQRRGVLQLQRRRPARRILREGRRLRQVRRRRSGARPPRRRPVAEEELTENLNRQGAADAKQIGTFYFLFLLASAAPWRSIPPPTNAWASRTRRIANSLPFTWSPFEPNLRPPVFLRAAYSRAIGASARSAANAATTAAKRGSSGASAFMRR